jgi:anti-anti-sigma factor
MKRGASAIHMEQPIHKVARIQVQGELGSAEERALASHLGGAARSEARDVIVDLTAVRYVSARALRQLVSARRQLAREGRRLILIAPEGPVRRAAELAGPGALEVYADEAEAFDDEAGESEPDS